MLVVSDWLFFPSSSHTLSHSNTHTHILTQSHTHTLTLWNTHSQSHTRTLTHTHTNSLSSFSLTHTHSHILSSQELGAIMCAVVVDGNKASNAFFKNKPSENVEVFQSFDLHNFHFFSGLFSSSLLFDKLFDSASLFVYFFLCLLFLRPFLL